MEIPKKAISIRQPWAWAIIHGGKDIENRTWATSYRGPVAIHAAKVMGKEEYYDAARFITRAIGTVDNYWLMRWHGVCASPDKINRGGIIGVADIVDCVSESDSPWFFGPYGFVIANAKPIDFIEVKGSLGFFDWRKNV